MPCGHGRTSGRSGKLIDRGGCALSKRYLDQNNHKLCSKECQGPKSVLRNSEQRCIILTFVTLELDTWKILAPFSLLLQGSDMKNCLDAEARRKQDGLESLSPPISIIFQVNLPEQKMDSSERPSSAKSCSSSGVNILGQSCNRDKHTNSVGSSSNTPMHSSIVSNNFTGPSSDGSDFLVNNHSEVDKPVKQISRKKRKKKGKKYKKPMRKKDPSGLETPCVETSSGDSFSETSISSGVTSTSEFNSQSNMSEKVTESSLSVHDTAEEKYDLCEPIASSAHTAAYDDVSLSKLEIDGGFVNLAFESSSTHPPEIVTLSSFENATSSYSSDLSCSISSDEYNTTIVDNFIDNWQKELSENCSSSVDTHASNKDDDRQNLSKVVLHIRDDTSCCSITEDSCDKNSETLMDCYNYWSKDIVDTDNSTERAHCSTQASSSDGFQPVINRRKRDRLTKRLSQGLIETRAFGTVHGQTGKNSNCSIWQRFQNSKTENHVCISKKKATLVAADVRGSDVKERFDTFVGLKHNGSGNSCAYTSSEMASPITQSKTSSNHANEGKVQPIAIDGIYNAQEKLKRKPSLASKQVNHCPVKLSHTDKTACRPKNHVQQRELETSLRETHQQCISMRSSSSSNDSPNAMVMPSDRVDSCQSESHHEKQINLEDTLSGNISMVSDMSSDVSESQISPSLMASRSLDQRHAKVQFENRKEISTNSTGEDFRYMKSETKSSSADLSEQDTTNSVHHKWAPAIKKDSVPSDMNQKDNLTDIIVNDPVLISLNPNEVESSYSNSDYSPQMSGLSGLSPWFRETPPSPEADLQTICRSHEYEDGGVLAKSNSCLTPEVKSKCLSDFEIDLDNKVQAVGDSYKLQTASEVIHMVTSSPIAEIERFLKLVSPVLDNTYCSRNCRTCPLDHQLIGQSLCQHQIPSIPLGCLWQWYERPGNYGMEVKLEDYSSSKRSHNGQYDFSAYFVPYLSAVQLFGWSRSCVYAENVYPNKEVIKACEAAAEDKINNKSFRSTVLRDGELLFEYFESDLPHLRRPLFDKIKQLVGGGMSSDGKIYGDPMKLENLNLNDLHPSSWYSVAWYPIYQIPDGEFRTAFLTYHSLGHFVHTSNTSCGIANIVSPVVGLQSYKAKEECWFRPKVPQQEAALSPDPSEILKERLRMLEQTASVMAKASVRNDGARAEFRQRDYKFFREAASRDSSLWRRAPFTR